MAVTDLEFIYLLLCQYSQEDCVGSPFFHCFALIQPQLCELPRAISEEPHKKITIELLSCDQEYSEKHLKFLSEALIYIDNLKILILIYKQFQLNVVHCYVTNTELYCMLVAILPSLRKQVICKSFIPFVKENVE